MRSTRSEIGQLVGLGKDTAKASEELYSKSGIHPLYHYCSPIHLQP